MCAEGKLFFDFEHGVLIGFATEGHGLCFPFAIFMPLLVFLLRLLDGAGIRGHSSYFALFHEAWIG